MNPSGEDLLRLGKELVDAFNFGEMIALGRKINFDFDGETTPGPLPDRTGEMVATLIRRGHLHRLLDAAQEQRAAVQDLQAIASHLREATNLTFPLRQQLLQILESQPVPAKQLQAFYVSAWPNFVPNRRAVTTAFEAAMSLARIPVDSGSTDAEKYPVLVFVERVAALWLDTGKLAAAQSLIDWSERLAASFCLSPGAIRQLRTDARSSRPVLNHLLIQFHPLGAKYRLQAYLWLDGDVCVIECDEQARAVAELPAAVDPIVGEAGRLAGTQFVIEFQVPVSLLAEDFDRWMIKLEYLDYPIGGLYPVVLRLYERVNPEKRESQLQINRWKDKWRTLASAGRPEFYWIDDAAIPAKTVFSSLSVPAGPHCAALGFAMPSSEKVCQAVLVALSAGVPVFVWFRQPLDAAALKLEIEQAMKNLNAFEEMPNLIYQYRTAVGGNESHPANHFTLFFDDPDRVPPPIQPRTLETSS